MIARARLLPLLLLAALLGLAFGPHLGGAWVWDDVYLVQENPNLRTWSGLHVLLTRDLWSSAGRATSDLYHPIPMALMWLVARCGGHSVAAFRVVNMALHGACVVLLAAFLRRRELPAFGVLFAAGLFAVHPLVTEPVMWVTGCHDTLAALGCLVALLAWPTERDARPHARILVATAATAWAALCKEPYFAFPTILLVAATVSGRGKTPLDRAARVAAPMVALGLVVALRRHLEIATGSAAVHGSLRTLLLDYATIVAHYLGLAVTFRTAATTESFRPLSLPAAALVLTLIAAVTAFVFVRYRERRPSADVLVVGWAWFLLALAPHTVATPVIGMYGNRYAYFPMMGLAALAVALARPLAERLAVPPFRVLAPLAPLAVLTLVPFTAAAARLWRDELTLFGADVEQRPDDARALYHYGHAVQVKSGCAAALPFFERSAAREPTYGRAWHNVAGCLVDLRRYRDALAPAETARALEPRDPGAAFNLAVARLGTGDPTGARALLDEALGLDPHHAGASRLLAQLGASAGPASP